MQRESASRGPSDADTLPLGQTEWRVKLMRRLIVSMVAAVVAVSLVPIASAQEEDDQVTLRVGLTQDWEVLNPTSGYTVPAYEVWNLHYATLTDKAARRLRHDPGSGRIVGGGRARHRVRLHPEGGPDLVGRRAAHRRRRRVEHQHRPRSGLGQHGFDSCQSSRPPPKTSEPSGWFLRSRPQASHHGRLSGARSTSGSRSPPTMTPPPNTPPTMVSAAGRSS